MLLPELATAKRFEPIAIIGVGAIFPGANNANEFWQNIITGKDLITDVPAGHWLLEDYYDPNPAAIDKTYCKRGAFLQNIAFDCLEYGIPPSNVPAIDTSQLLALLVAKQVLTDATGRNYLDMDLSRTGVILGAAALEALQYVAGRMQRPVWEKALQDFGMSSANIEQICNRISASYTPWQENTFPGLLGNVIAGRIANRFNLGGTNCITDAACAGSLSALTMAISELQLGHADMMITGGVDTLNDIVMFMCFSKTQALSLSGDCRPFSSQADGTILGEGIGMFALKRLADAEAQGDKIYAVIRGLGTSSDGRAKSIYAPLASGQSKAVLRAYDMAGYSPSTVGLIEAHGTGTKAGDKAEFSGLQLAFTSETASAAPHCALGSIKSQIGHTKSAAGAAGLFKAVMALHHKVLPPTIKIDEPNPELDFAHSPFYLNTQLRPWITAETQPRRAGVSSFGFGGTNFHVALEEYTGNNKKAHRLRTAPTELILFSAKTPTALISLCKKMLADGLQAESLAQLARTSQETFVAENLARLAIVASNLEDLRQKLTHALTQINPKTTHYSSQKDAIHYGYANDPGKVAFVFPGQGSQYVNMGADLTMNFAAAMDVWEQMNACKFQDSEQLANIVFPKPVFDKAEQQRSHERLKTTQWAQPALAVTSLVHLTLLKQLQIYPDCVAGHSFGELTALHAAGVMDAATLLKMAYKRGELMQAASQIPGAMLAILHPVQDVLALIENARVGVVPANFNSPQQLVVAGSIEAIVAAEQLLQQHAIKFMRLPVATAFHSELVSGACAPFKEFLDTLTFKTPQIPVYANTSAQPYPSNIQAISDYLAQQLRQPVKFQQIVADLYANDVRTFIEVGAQGVLTGLIKQCLADKEVYCINLDQKAEHGLTQLWHALGQLTVLGLNPDFTVLWHEYDCLPQENTLTKSNSHSTLQLNGTNYGKPYPAAKKHAVRPPSDLQLTQPATVNYTSVAGSDVTARVINDEENTMSQTNNAYLLHMYQELQKQLVDAHNTYQKAMADSHIAFLNSIGQLANQAAAGAGLPMTAPLAMPAMPVPTVTMNAAPMQPIAQSVVPPVTMMSPPPAHAFVVPPLPLATPSMPSQPVTPQPVITPATPAPIAATVMPEVPNAHTNEAMTLAQLNNTGKQNKTTDLQTLLLEIVVDKTGYPVEMLNMDMAIEADLGIDSIKRVEILSSLSERIPNLPELEPTELAELRTLGDIAAYLQRHPVNGSLVS